MHDELDGRADRRSVLRGAGALLAAFGIPAPLVEAAQRAAGDPFRLRLGEPQPFSREALLARVEAMAGQDYRPPVKVPADWQTLTYDQYRAIRFKHTAALWRDEQKDAYALEFFAPGLYYPEPIEVFAVNAKAGEARAVLFDRQAFSVADIVPALSDDPSLGFSGFRIIGTPSPGTPPSEVVVFQGASYFRSFGLGQNYGLSARGLAVDTAAPSGEEFPAFRSFYVEGPARETTKVRLHAVLDGPSVVGLYTFDIDHAHDHGGREGAMTRMEVDAALFPRRALDNVGLAPLTSMFLFDATNDERFDDFRPAVHDSEGLLVDNGAGERLWRPLANPKALQVSSFVDAGPRGFGLVQRSLDYRDYADLEADYHRRPSLWVTPRGDWGQGAVTLVEIPADKEIYDNIVAYWRPRQALEPGMRHDFAYALQWGSEAMGLAGDGTGLSRVMETRIGARPSFGPERKPGRLVVIEFGAEALPEGLDEGEFEIWRRGVTVHASANGGVPVSDGVLQRNEETGGLHLAFHFDPGDRTAVELRAQLVDADGRALSEVWLYRWTP